VRLIYVSQVTGIFSKKGHCIETYQSKTSSLAYPEPNLASAVFLSTLTWQRVAMKLAFMLLWTGKSYVCQLLIFPIATSPVLQGNPLFQSMMVLYSVELDLSFPHDHLDDLESFFYILLYIVYTYDCQGLSHPMDKLLKQWKKKTGTTAAEAKVVFFLLEHAIPKTIASRWPKALLNVLSEFRAFLMPLSQKKVSIRYMKAKKVPEILRDLAFNVDQHYDGILRIFDTGIEALEKIDSEETALRVPPTNPATSSLRSPPQNNPLKRMREEETDSQPAAKRSNHSAQA
jgi:hypothetical protein